MSKREAARPANKPPMSSFRCVTCSETLANLVKHLSQTRHKKVDIPATGETVECEDCGDDNIHLIRLVRYGFADLALLCSACSENRKDEEVTEYNLSNGSLFLKLPLYYKFRDAKCVECHKDRNLSIGVHGSGTIIYCDACLSKNEIHKGKNFCSQKDPKFYSILLEGEEQFLSTDASKRSKPKVTRKATRPVKVKKVHPDAEQRRAHYESKKAVEAAFKSGKTIKAVGSSSNTPPTTGRSTPKPKVAVLNLKKDSGPRLSLDKNVPKGMSPNMGPSARQSKRGVKNKIEAVQSSSKKSSNSKSADSTLNPIENLNLKSKIEKLDKSTAKPKSTIQKGKVKAEEETKGRKSTKGETMEKANADKKSFSKEQKGVKKAVKSSDKKVSSTSEAKSPEVAKKNSNQKALKGNQIDSVPQFPPGIVKYEPSKTPKITYDSMNEYYNEMCYNLFLEEKASLSMSNNIVITSNEFELEWYADQDKKHKQFKFNVSMTPEFYDRFVSKKMQALKKLPFSVNQGVFLILNDNIVWYGNIVLCDLGGAKGKKGSKKGRGKPSPSSKSILEVMVELYSWNNMPLPLSVNADLLKIMPASIPVSRVFLAMSRINNPKFIDMILGKKPIKQIVFKNFLKFTKDTFNESQKIAIQSVLNNSITVLQGPPGTGKTSTIYEIILQLLENLNTFPILVVAASNIAIDNIAEKLMAKHGKSILRIVSNEKEPEYNREHPLSSICLHHKVFDGLPLHFQDTIREMRRPGSTISQSQYKKLLSAQIDYTNTIIGLARVIFTTTVVAGGNQLKPVQKMPVVIMDEATQSSEPTTLIPLSMPGVEKFVFVGDQKQLSSFSQVPNLSLSLFERIIISGTYKTPHMLDTQYRMHPAISEFPRRKFYDGLLKDGITAEDRAKTGIPANPVLFWDTRGKSPESMVRARFREDNGLTYANKREVNYVENVLTNLIYEKGVQRSEIGVITPYRGQRDLISSTLVKNELINPEKAELQIEVDRDDIFNDSKPVTIHMVSDIMIASIDAFQGREKDFMVMSCVRSNEQNKIGFLNDARRMNVALTRARYGLILVGDMECLYQADPLWREYIDVLKSQNCILNSDQFKYA